MVFVKSFLKFFIILFVLSLFSLQFKVTAAKDLVCQVIQSNGYPCEVHHVITSDGYHLKLHRIPPKHDAMLKNSTIGKPTPTPPPQQQQQQLLPYILFHGIIGSAADFVLAGRKRALGCILHDQGFDVWLPNARGTTHSKRHARFDSSMSSFWNFTWHEIGYYDLPAIVDYVLDNTGQRKLHYVAHSQGSTVFFVLLSERPEYNQRFATAALLAPVAYLNNLQSPPLRLMAVKYNQIEALLNHLGLHELFPSTALNQLGGHLLCGEGVPTQNFCLLATFFSVGFSDYQFDRALFPRILETTPAGISAKQLQHFGQIINSGKFQKYDYMSKNLNSWHYQRKTPPEYNLANVRVPLQLFFGNRDRLVTKEDIRRLTRKLKNARYTLNEVIGFNHIDMLYATVASNLVYKQIVTMTKNFK